MPRKADLAMNQKVQQEIAASVHRLADTIAQGGGAPAARRRCLSSPPKPIWSCAASRVRLPPGRGARR